ncbi:ferredoxin reductase domain-containing protein [Anthocerotibacter panamensis]|uniref:ferredoxin--NADP(+) reductase n=1 Tax=Anthocerotibacter panamensis TaxID=2857077 RepID=UPI001C404C09|nr:ferredoxin--NADP(+) reductase [Anthocerotibacter panamensis]
MAHATARTGEIPVNTYRPNAPYKGKAVYVERLTPDDSPNDVRHIVLDLKGGDLTYLEGQSIGIVPPGTDAKGKPHKLRLYSIASTRTGDDGGDGTVALCVKRVVYIHPETKEEVRGVASNFLCDLQPEDDVLITGPVGKNFLLPEDPTANLVLIATGTGIAPFRAFLKHIYEELPVPWQGKVWLFFGVQTSVDVLYKDMYEKFEASQPNFTLSLAISREQKNVKGEKMYVQNRIAEHTEELWSWLEAGNTYTYICGLRGMENGIDAAFSEVATARGQDWSKVQYDLKQAGFWHVETY